MLINIPKEDKIVVTHGEKYESKMWESQTSNKEVVNISNTEDVLAKFKNKCVEAGVRFFSILFDEIYLQIC
jgi:hypothetical protein